MAWIVLDLDDTLVTQDPMSGEDMPTDGAIEAAMALEAQGHRLTIWTSRFAPMPESERQRLKEQIEQELIGLGFPMMEVWTGTTKPAADVYVDNKAVTFDNDWNLALAQVEFMLEDRGLMPHQQLDSANNIPNEETTDGQEESDGSDSRE